MTEREVAVKQRSFLLATASVVLGLSALAGCDDRLAMQPSRDHRSAELASATSTTAPSESVDSAAPTGRAPRTQKVSAPVALVQGKPMWAENRTHTAQENADYQFQQHGGELGARDVDDFVAKAHRFVNSPPEGVKTLTRANGDTLMFDGKSGLFGVVRSDGAPRTVFKPETGKAYWDEQVASQGDNRRTTANRRAARDDRG
jgi:pyocin large subunit-like protein